MFHRDSNRHCCVHTCPASFRDECVHDQAIQNLISCILRSHLGPRIMANTRALHLSVFCAFSWLSWRCVEVDRLIDDTIMLNSIICPIAAIGKVLAEQHKQRGNEALGKGHYRKASDCYSMGDTRATLIWNHSWNMVTIHRNTSIPNRCLIAHNHPQPLVKIPVILYFTVISNTRIWKNGCCHTVWVILPTKATLIASPSNHA